MHRQLQPKGAFLQYQPSASIPLTPPVHQHATRRAQQARAVTHNNTQQPASAAASDPPSLSASISLPSPDAPIQRRQRAHASHHRRIMDDEEEEQREEKTMTTEQGAAAMAASAQMQLSHQPQSSLDSHAMAAASPLAPSQRSPQHALVAYVPSVAGVAAGALTVAGAGGGLASVADSLSEDGECEEVSQLERCNVQDRVALTAAVRRVQELCRRTKGAADRSRLSTAESDTLRGLAQRVWLWCNRQAAQLAACKDIHAAGQ